MPLFLHPERFHGENKSHDYFEGWYFKCVNISTGFVFAVVPGIFHSHKVTPEHSHAFIFVNINGKEQHYYRFPVDAFVASKDEFKVTIAGKNVFSASELTLNLNPTGGDDATLSLQGSLQFSQNFEWPVSIASPGVMGLVTYMPRVECFHGIVSMDHEINGSMIFNQVEERFEGGRGYLEKDWGKRFPSAWVWIQTNVFPDSDIQQQQENGAAVQNPSLFFSAAHVPYMGTSFPGFICGFLDTEGHLHKFATYLMSSVNIFKVDYDSKTVQIELQNWSHVLEISASFDVPMVPLYGPIDGQMKVSVPEGLLGEVNVRLCKSGARDVTLFDSKGVCAGIEVQGDLVSLCAGLSKVHLVTGVEESYY